MPVELHERLSEFSYGYGVTREVERALAAQGLTAVPFLPSLLHEAELGFDVGFNLPGAPLLLQFKLGQAMRRFTPGRRPHLNQPFWRFKIDTSEPDGQYELLLKAEQDGAEVYYVAPKFHDWEAYLDAFRDETVLHDSLLVTPGAIDDVIDANGLADGPHKVAYDHGRAYLCSEPHPLKVVRARNLAKRLRRRIEVRKTTLAASMRQVLAGFGERATVRRQGALKIGPERASFEIPSDSGDEAALRQARFDDFLGRAKTADDAVAAAVGVEAWACGAQLMMATLAAPI